MPDSARELARRVSAICAEADKLQAEAASLATNVLDAGPGQWAGEYAERIRQAVDEHADRIDLAIGNARASVCNLRADLSSATTRA